MVVSLETVPEAAEAEALTGFGSREQLLSDLAEAMTPGASQAVLTIFALEGFDDAVAALGRPESQALLTTLSASLERAVGGSASCYWPRENEFALLWDAGDPAHESLLDDALAALCGSRGPIEVTAAFGAVTVPDEASDPLGALRLADARLAAAQPRREPRGKRRHLRPVLRGADTAIETAADASSEPAVGLPARRWQVEQLLDLARTLGLLADAARIDDGQAGSLQGQAREPGRIPFLLKELRLKLTALRALGGPEIPSAAALVEEASPRPASIGGRVLAAMDEIDAALPEGAASEPLERRSARAGLSVLG